MLDLRRLRALRAVVETGSVTAAAEEVGYTPSAISQHVTSLERETGTVLLERAGRGVRPTAAGRLLASHAAEVMAKVAEAEAALAALRAGEMGTLRVASFPTAGAALVPPALARLRRRMPALEVDLRVAEAHESLPMVRQGELDLAVITYDPHLSEGRGEGLHLEHLLDDPFRVVLPRGHRLSRRRVLRLAELAGEAWVETMCSQGCCQNAAYEAYGRAGFTPRRAVQAAEYWPAQGFVAAGLGVALIPTLGLGTLHDGVVVRRLERSEEPVRRVQAATRPSIAGQPPVKAMLEALHEAAWSHRRTSA